MVKAKSLFNKRIVKWHVYVLPVGRCRDCDKFSKKKTKDTTINGCSKSNSNSLANQLGIHIILAKQEKLVSNSLANQLGKNRNLAKLTSPRAYMRARIVVAIVVSL
jgi:hypothetical protein